MPIKFAFQGRGKGEKATRKISVSSAETGTPGGVSSKTLISYYGREAASKWVEVLFRGGCNLQMIV